MSAQAESWAPPRPEYRFNRVPEELLELWQYDPERRYQTRAGDEPITEKQERYLDALARRHPAVWRDITVIIGGWSGCECVEDWTKADGMWAIQAFKYFERDIERAATVKAHFAPGATPSDVVGHLDAVEADIRRAERALVEARDAIPATKVEAQRIVNAARLEGQRLIDEAEARVDKAAYALQATYDHRAEVEAIAHLVGWWGGETVEATLERLEDYGMAVS